MLVPIPPHPAWQMYEEVLPIMESLYGSNSPQVAPDPDANPNPNANPNANPNPNPKTVLTLTLTLTLSLSLIRRHQLATSRDPQVREI